MKNHNFILFGGALLFLATVALACGPYFPQAFLPHRDALLKAPIEGDFAFEMRRYFSRVRSAASAPRIQHTESPAALRAKAEAEGVTADQYRVIQRMRQEKDGDAAYAIGKELPDAIRLYTAGAVDYQLAKSGACAKMRQGTDLNFENSACNPDRCDGFGCDSLAPALLPANPAIARALARFEAVLSLPENERQPRATWAAYSFAESHLNYQLPDRRNKASRYYELVRKLAQSGTPDPMQLAWSSLGQQALVKLEVGDTGKAVILYLEQGDVVSLRFVAERLIAQPNKLRSELKSPAVRRLVVAYVFSYGHAGPYSGKQPSWMRSTINALIASGTGDIENIDRLAALSYQAGKYEDAAQLAASSETPLAHWVKSKLARRNGDKALAADHLVLAGKNKSAVRKNLPSDLVQQLMLENVTVSLDRGETVKAMSALYAMGPSRWADIAYVAERLLTTDELRVFVDALPFAVRKKEGTNVKTEPPAMIVDTLSARFGHRTTGMDPNEVEPLDTAHQLRTLLARRLMRGGRFKIAMPYFSVAEPQVIAYAKEYAEAVRAAMSARAPIDRAEVLFKVGALVRKRGMEILGYELAPDFYYAKGNYAADSILQFKNNTGSSARVYGRASMSEEEVQRFNVTVPRLDKRYHYRYLAVEKAREAARLLPARSQAYRSVLCHAAAWSPDDALDSDLYKTYLRNGSNKNYQLAGLFGRECETPDFEGARRLNSQRNAKGN